MTSKDFLRLLFEPGEHTNVSPTLWMTAVIALDAIPDYMRPQYVCINALKPGTYRCDDNVVSYRSILVEMDNCSIDEQRKIIRDSGILYSAICFSGSKSLHAVITLETPLPDKKTYDALVKRIYRAMGGPAVVDVACGNPSRTTRFPNAIREETGQEQTLLELRERVPNADLEAWLTSKGALSEPERTYVKPAIQEGMKGHLRGDTLKFIMGIYDTGQWNRSLFKASCDLANNGYNEDEAIDKLQSITGTLDKKDMSTIKSAFKRVNS